MGDNFLIRSPLGDSQDIFWFHFPLAEEPPDAPPQITNFLVGGWGWEGG